jgi:hypothetical protein
MDYKPDKQGICSQCFSCFCRCILQVCLSERCMRFTHMLHVCLSGYCIYFGMTFSSAFRCFYKCFRRILQMFHLDVSKVVGRCISLLAFYCLASVSHPLLDAGDIRVTWARAEMSGMGGASRSSGAESERVGYAERSRRGAWGAASGCGPSAGRRSVIILQKKRTSLSSLSLMSEWIQGQALKIRRIITQTTEAIRVMVSTADKSADTVLLWEKSIVYHGW